MNQDYLYERAPLIEVIAEIHWALKPLQLNPQLKLDPHYESFEFDFQNYLSKIQLNHIEELIPKKVPLEILPNQPRIRIRSAPNMWPLAQAGPGIITANIVPPYNGWKEFEEFIFSIINGLYECYPLASDTLFVEKLHLRYIDGFDRNFGFTQFSKFAADMLGIQSPLSEKFLRNCTKSESELTYVLECRFSNASPEGSTGRIKIVLGTKNDLSALVLEMSCESVFPGSSLVSPDSVQQWFVKAHNCLHIQFDTITTRKLKSYFGKQRKIEK